ncbi:hypothetical protein JCM10450v2_005993 [Rhodotorula kratochvilovae]
MSDTSLPLLAIVGITVAAVLVLQLVLAALGYLFWRLLRRERRLPSKEGGSAEGGALEAAKSPASGRGSFLARWLQADGGAVYSPTLSCYIRTLCDRRLAAALAFPAREHAQPAVPYGITFSAPAPALYDPPPPEHPQRPVLPPLRIPTSSPERQRQRQGVQVRPPAAPPSSASRPTYAAPRTRASYLQRLSRSFLPPTSVVPA